MFDQEEEKSNLWAYGEGNSNHPEIHPEGPQNKGLTSKGKDFTRALFNLREVKLPNFILLWPSYVT